MKWTLGGIEILGAFVAWTYFYFIYAISFHLINRNGLIMAIYEKYLTQLHLMNLCLEKPINKLTS